MSSILKKQIVAVTGLVFVGFVIGHMAGNTLIFGGSKVFNEYAAMLHAVGELLWLVRIVLLTAFVVHVVFTILLVLENRKARDGRYAVSNTKGGSLFASKTMIYTGLLVFFFVILHLFDFTIPTGEAHTALTEEGLPDVYSMVWNSFLVPWRAIVYILAMVAVGFHLSHAIQSLFQTLGVNHKRYTEPIRKISIVLGVVVAVGFSLVPIYVNIIGMH